MAQSRNRKSPLSLVLVAALAVGAGAALVAPGEAQAGDKKACHKHDSKYQIASIQKLCEGGDRKPAIKAMKKAWKKLKDAEPDAKWRCDSCHKKGNKGGPMKDISVDKAMKIKKHL